MLAALAVTPSASAPRVKLLCSATATNTRRLASGARDQHRAGSRAEPVDTRHAPLCRRPSAGKPARQRLAPAAQSLLSFGGGSRGSRRAIPYLSSGAALIIRPRALR